MSSVVQHASQPSSAPALPGNVTIGNLVFLYCSASTGNVLSVTGLGATWSFIDRVTSEDGETQEVWYCTAQTATNDVALTHDSASASITVVETDLTQGIVASHTTATGHNTGTAAVGGLSVLTDDIVFTAGCVSNDINDELSIPAGYTDLGVSTFSLPNRNPHGAYKVPGGAGTETANWTSAQATHQWVELMVVFRHSSNQPPTAAFTWISTDLAVTFNASGSSDPDGTIASYAWDFGDGNSGSGLAPNHTYAGAGSYTVVLTVTDNQGATNAVSHTVAVSISNQPPVAAFSYSTDQLTVTLDSSASVDHDGIIVSRSWDFGDGHTSGVVSPTHTFAAAGTYTVQLTVTDNDGATNSVSHDVTVSITNTAPTAVISSVIQGLTVQFYGTGSVDPDGTIVSYLWDFGDGATSTSATPTHTYTAHGTYTVSLTVTDDLGAAGATTASVTPNYSFLLPDDRWQYPTGDPLIDRIRPKRGICVYSLDGGVTWKTSAFPYKGDIQQGEDAGLGITTSMREGVDYFLGGHHYNLTAAQKAVLDASGYGAYIS